MCSVQVTYKSEAINHCSLMTELLAPHALSPPGPVLQLQLYLPSITQHSCLSQIPSALSTFSHNTIHRANGLPLVL